MTKIADDFAAIRRRCAEMNGDAIAPETNTGKAPPLETQTFVVGESFAFPQAVARSIIPVNWRADVHALHGLKIFDPRPRRA